MAASATFNECQNSMKLTDDMHPLIVCPQCFRKITAVAIESVKACRFLLALNITKATFQ